MSIRPLQDGDFDRWKPLWDGYLTFYEADLPESVAHSTFARIIDPEGDLHGFGWFSENGEMLGMTTFLYHPTTWDERYRCYLNDLFTVPAARGKGVARALIEAVYDAAAAAGSDQVYWTTQEFNYAGRMLYDRVGSKTPFIKYNKVLDT
ncbi:GNAT family N-acetyltransferase [Ahrensia sp. R2A130]|uniref:GNAT family N-acetyltransferase n=1 Tax=Ahrensia sp. R2A130 TaxID=744979 RepID=UPI0001E0BC3C|nr:GNAT family N-acetyltransferase [Ahrensia sp. R2A130]EFL90750.1 N-acetyltransferase HPA3 [Ahrensia sp. R2A130]